MRAAKALTVGGIKPSAAVLDLDDVVGEKPDASAPAPLRLASPPGAVLHFRRPSPIFRGVVERIDELRLGLRPAYVRQRQLGDDLAQGQRDALNAEGLSL
jgi:hypothetical protein